jgi:exodeoxyribonuclease V alpha subunit
MYTIIGKVCKTYKENVKLKIYKDKDGASLKNLVNEEWIQLPYPKGNSQELTLGNEYLFNIDKSGKHIKGVSPYNKNQLFEAFINAVGINGVNYRDKRSLHLAFGRELFEIAYKKPSLLASRAMEYGYAMSCITHIASKSKKLQDLFLQTEKMRDSGLSQKDVLYLCKKYGSNLMNIIKERPYNLLSGHMGPEIDRYGSLANDVKKIGIIDKLITLNTDIIDDVSFQRRFRTSHAMSMATNRLSQEGHTAFPKKTVTSLLSELTGLSVKDSEKTIDSMVSSLFYKQVKTSDGAYFVTPYSSHERDDFIFNKIKSRLSKEGDVKVGRDDLILEDYYNPEQVSAIKHAIESQLLVVTGGAGTGKTTVIKGIIANIYKTFGKSSEIILCAPTGKAAQRMTEATGAKSRTLHSLLYAIEHGSKPFNERVKMIIVDEASMLDTQLVANLLRALPENVKLVLTGDTQQVLPVKPGQPFKDMINSGAIPSVRLVTPNRTSAQSLIYTNSVKMIHGILPDLENKEGSDFIFIPSDNDEDILNHFVDILKNKNALFPEVNYENVQLLSPMKDPKGLLGTINLNQVVKSIFNNDESPSIKTSRGTSFKTGDRVIFNENDASLGLYNGDVGKVIKVDVKALSADVEVDGKVVTIPSAKLPKLELSNCLTIHKTQGSEYEIVIMPITARHSKMLDPELIYTGITRAKKVFAFVGDPKVLDKALHNVNRNERFTYLGTKLSELGISMTKDKDKGNNKEIEKKNIINEAFDSLSFD